MEKCWCLVIVIPTIISLISIKSWGVGELKFISVCVCEVGAGTCEHGVGGPRSTLVTSITLHPSLNVARLAGQ